MCTGQFFFFRQMFVHKARNRLIDIWAVTAKADQPFQARIVVFKNWKQFVCDVYTSCMAEKIRIQVPRNNALAWLGILSDDNVRLCLYFGIRAVIEYDAEMSPFDVSIYQVLEEWAESKPYNITYFASSHGERFRQFRIWKHGGKYVRHSVWYSKFQVRSDDFKKPYHFSFAHSIAPGQGEYRGMFTGLNFGLRITRIFVNLFMLRALCMGRHLGKANTIYGKVLLTKITVGMVFSFAPW